MKRALITGITGQDGSYLVDLLLSKGYEVHGIKRSASTFNTERIEHLYEGVDNLPMCHMHYGDLLDTGNLLKILYDSQPDEIYNLASLSHVNVSFELPEYTGNVNGLGTVRLLEAIRSLKMLNKCKIYQASTSELFGKVVESPQNEKTPFHPRSPYAVAKLYSFWIIKNYREAYGLFASNGILFNHESERRGKTFVTRKITRGIARLLTGKLKHISLGNLNAIRDWGHASDYVEAMWRILQHNVADDWVVATGVATSVRDFCQMAFRAAGIEIQFEGRGYAEVARVVGTSANNDFLKEGQIVIRVDPQYYRPAEVDSLLGDPAKIKKELNWQPKFTLNDIIKEMVEADYKLEQT